MAMTFERRQASLISGGDLPNARLQPSTPDLSGLNRMAGALLASGDKKRREEDAKKAQDDRIKGAEAADAQRGTYVGVDVDGKPKPFALPDGSVSYRQGYQEAAESNLAAQFRTGISAQFSDIHRKVEMGEIDAAQANDLMRAALDGALEAAPEFQRSNYREFGEGQITQRTTLMTSQADARDADLQATGLDAQVKNELDLGSANASAGLPADQNVARASAAIDTLVKLKRVSPEKAKIMKEGIGQVIVAQGLTSRLARDLNNGLISPADMDQLALGIESGDEFELLVPGEDDMGRPGRATIGYKSTTILKKVQDKQLRSSMSQTLREAATDYRQRYEANRETRETLAELEWLGRPENKDQPYMGSKEKADMLMQRIITDGKAMDTPEGAASMVSLLQRLKYAPGSLVSTLRNMTSSGDEAQITKAIKVYQMVTTLQDKWGGYVGASIYDKIPEGDREVLDAYRAGFEANIPVLDIRQAMTKLKGPEAMSMADAVGGYNRARGADDKAFYKAFNEKWSEDFEGVFPPDAKDAFERAYRMHYVITNDSGKAFDSAYKAIAGRYTKSDIFVGGVEKTGLMPPVNPEGYESGRRTVFGTNAFGTDYEWLEEDIRINLASAALVEDEGITKDVLAGLLNQPPGTIEGMAQQVTDIYDGPDFLGRTIKLQPTNTNTNQPEFQLRVYDKGGNDLGYLKVMGPDGNERPLTINPWERHAAMTQRDRFDKKKASLEAGARSELLEKRSELFELYNGKGVIAAPPQTYEDFEEFLKTVEPPDRQKYKLDVGEIQKGFDRQMEKLETEGGVEPSKGVALDQQSLVLPRGAGFNVTANAVAAVDAIIPDGTSGQFMMRVAAQESNFGKAGGTFRTRGDRGIFQVNTGSGFVEVVRQAQSGTGRVYEASQKLKNSVLGIDVANLTAADLDKPVVAAAVARLYFLVTSRDIPQDVAGQADLWKDHYNTRLGAGTTGQFIRSSSKVPEDFTATAFLTADQG